MYVCFRAASCVAGNPHQAGDGVSQGWDPSAFSQHSQNSSVVFHRVDADFLPSMTPYITSFARLTRSPLIQIQDCVSGFVYHTVRPTIQQVLLYNT